MPLRYSIFVHHIYSYIYIFTLISKLGLEPGTSTVKDENHTFKLLYIDTSAIISQKSSFEGLKWFDRNINAEQAQNGLAETLMLSLKEELSKF